MSGHAVGRAKNSARRGLDFAIGLIRAGFELFGMRHVAVIAGNIKGFVRRLAEPHQRRGSKPARNT